MSKDWANKYWELIMSKEDDPAFELKYRNFPKSFFKYRSLTSQTIEMISENKIWLAEISSLNDPFECSLQFDNNASLRMFYADNIFHKTFQAKTGISLTKKEISELSNSDEPYETYGKLCLAKGIKLNVSKEDQLLTVQSRWAEIIEQTNENIRICSFSEVNNSLLLWSHYANEHKGFCIEYDLSEEDDIRPFLHPIVYSEKINKIKTFDDLNVLTKIGSTLIKCKDWEYESEWRLIITKQENNFPRKMRVPDPKAVYLGTRFYLNAEEDRIKLLSILKDRGIPFFQMTKHPDEYKLIEK